MVCKYCGEQLKDGDNFCTNCGAFQQVNQQQMNQNYANQQQMNQNYMNQQMYNNTYNGNEIMSSKQFLERFASKKSKNWVTACIVICTISACSCVVTILFYSILAIIDFFVYTTVALILLKYKNWIPALCMSIYSAIACVLNMAQTGSPKGILGVVICIGATRVLYKISAAYKNYKLYGVYPESEL